MNFSLTLGMTFQTSDVTITGAHMRKVVLCWATALPHSSSTWGSWLSR
ncbi:DUF1345 domain-containing protein [Cupriavidus oxalaticus]